MPFLSALSIKKRLKSDFFCHFFTWIQRNWFRFKYHNDICFRQNIMANVALNIRSKYQNNKEFVENHNTIRS